MAIKVNSLKQNKSELEITGTGLNESYISVLIDGALSEKLFSEYSKIIAVIPQNTRIKTVSVHLFINENKNRYYINVGFINIKDFKVGIPVATVNLPQLEPVPPSSLSSLSDFSSESSEFSSSSSSSGSNSSAPVVDYTRYFSVSPSTLYGYTAPLVSDIVPSGYIVGGNAFPHPGYAFVRWITSDAVLNWDARIPDIQHVMPSNDVHFIAEFSVSFTKTLTLINAYGFVYSGEGTIPDIVPGAYLYVYSNPPFGFTFGSWTVSPPEMAVYVDSISDPAIFRMPSFDVTLEANFVVAPFNVYVYQGSGSGQFFEGVTVWVYADYPPPGYQFSYWSSYPSVTFDDAFNQYASFVMPAGTDVYVSANFDLIVYTISVTNGTADAYTFTVYDSYVMIYADPPPDGMVFDHWEGDTYFLDDPALPNATFYCYYANFNVAFTAVYV
jgi:hypothetical protein